MDRINETSYGIIPLRFEEGIWNVFIVKNRNGDFWGFPKGHGASGETSLETAQRELIEETGLGIERMLKMPPLKEEYQFQRGKTLVDKLVIFYPALVSKIITLDEKEILDGKWVLVNDLEKEISFPEGKQVAKALIEQIKTQML